MPKKNEVGYWIKRKGNSKVKDTKPERVVGIFLEELGFYLNHLVSPIEAQDDVGKYWTITPDIQLTTSSVYPLSHVIKTIVEVDGVYHDTPIQRKKTEWRDGLLTKAGFRVIHVDAELTKNKVYQTYLKDKLAEAINSKEVIVRIDA